MTRNEFENLHSGQIIYHTMYYNKDDTPERWKVNGKMQGSLKTGSAKWPIEHGLYDFGFVQLDNMHLFTISERVTT